MKIKGLRWYIIGLIMLITIINYLDRGTLNYMWLANIDYEVVTEQTTPDATKGNYAVAKVRGTKKSLTTEKSFKICKAFKVDGISEFFQRSATIFNPLNLFVIIHLILSC